MIDNRDFFEPIMNKSRPPRFIRDSSLIRDESLMNLGGRGINNI
jgi:hypothetical protein